MDAIRYQYFSDHLQYPPNEESEKQELFTRTFDIQAPCCLEVGYAIFGEDYKRGHLLVQLQSLHQEFNNDCGSELADHLTNVLTLIPKMYAAHAEDTHEFVSFIVLSGVEKMLEALKDNANPYRQLLETIFETLKNDFEPHWVNPWPKKSSLDLPNYHKGGEAPPPGYESEDSRYVDHSNKGGFL